MTTYYEVEVKKTSKPVGNSQVNYTIFDQQTKQFASVSAIKIGIEVSVLLVSEC